MNYKYDVMGRLTSLATDEKNWKEQIKGYDSVGNILEIELNDDIGETSSTFTYDDLDQITSETGTAPHSYSYDSHYNRRSKDGAKQILNDLHQLIDDGVNTYTYDFNGNMRLKKSQEHISEFVYDALDRLVSFVKGDRKFVYSYDESNRRLSKTTFAIDVYGECTQLESERYLYHGQNEIGAIDKNGKITELRLIGVSKGAEIGGAIAMEFDQKVYVPLHDHNGNVSCLLDGATGEITETYRYSSFGEELFDGSNAISPWRFSSKRTDNETGFVYFGRRYYDPEIGRWVTPDPIGREGGPNLYAYVLNRSLTHFDLYGLFGMDSIRSGFESMCDCISNCLAYSVSTIAKIPGQALSLISRELLPLPYVQEMVDFGGWCLRGENPSQYNWKQFQSKFLVYEGTNPGNPNHIHAQTNGIMTPESDLIDRMAKQSEAYGGITVYGLYNGCRGAIFDLIETGCQMLGIPTYGQQLANKSMHWLRNKQGENWEQTTIFTEAHSRGTETIYHFDKELRQHMEVTGFGPARIAEVGHFKDSNYYISSLDIVPLANPLGLFDGIKNGNVHYLPTNGNPLSDHLYENKYFAGVREKKGLHYQRSRLWGVN